MAGEDDAKPDEKNDDNAASYDTGDPQAVNAARRRAGRYAVARKAFVLAAMQQQQGRAWFYDVLVRCHIFQTPFRVGDPYSTSFSCGEQNIGLQILADIQDAAPDFYTKMIEEGKARG